MIKISRIIVLKTLYFILAILLFCYSQHTYILMLIIAMLDDFFRNLEILLLDLDLYLDFFGLLAQQYATQPNQTTYGTPDK